MIQLKRNQLNHRLSVLHSYKIAKKYIRLKKPMEAARNLLRVGNNITMFEEDKVKIMMNLKKLLLITKGKVNMVRQGYFMKKSENIKKR